MSSTLYCSKVVEIPKFSVESLKFIFRELFQEDHIDFILGDNEILTLEAIKISSNDENIIADVTKIIELLRLGSRLRFKEEY